MNVLSLLARPIEANMLSLQVPSFTIFSIIFLETKATDVGQWRHYGGTAGKTKNIHFSVIL